MRVVVQEEGGWGDGEEGGGGGGGGGIREIAALQDAVRLSKMAAERSAADATRERAAREKLEWHAQV